MSTFYIAPLGSARFDRNVLRTLERVLNESNAQTVYSSDFAQIMDLFVGAPYYSTAPILYRPDGKYVALTLYTVPSSMPNSKDQVAWFP